MQQVFHIQLIFRCRCRDSGAGGGTRKLFCLLAPGKGTGTGTLISMVRQTHGKFGFRRTTFSTLPSQIKYSKWLLAWPCNGGLTWCHKWHYHATCGRVLFVRSNRIHTYNKFREWVWAALPELLMGHFHHSPSDESVAECSGLVLFFFLKKWESTCTTDKILSVLYLFGTVVTIMFK